MRLSLHAALLVALHQSLATNAGSAIVARVPPKGWNSWDGYRRDLNETELMKLAPAWAKLMLPSGYDTVTIDEFWYPNDGEAANSLDKHGRAVVDEAKWPSAKGGKGFSVVADKIHALGLKLGIHVMHGIPREAVNKTDAHLYTVLGTGVQVSTLSDGTWCDWNPGWGRVDMSKPGAQEYFDSIYAQYADWGVDFIKNDCVFGKNFALNSTFTNIQAARKAMDKTGHTFVYSLSPGFAGDSPLVETALKVTSPLVNMYRMTLDWHGWHGRDGEPGWPNHFELAAAYSAYEGSVGAHGKSWPDLDMLNPFDDHESMIMQQSLWAIARSPLIYGGKAADITTANPHIAILTNPRVLAVSDTSSHNRQVKRSNSSAVWVAQTATSGSVYVGLFRLTNSSGGAGLGSPSSDRGGGAAVQCSTLEPPFCTCAGGAGNPRNCSCASCGKCGCKSCRICDGAVDPAPPAPKTALVSATFAELGLPAGVTSANVTDLWSGGSLAKAKGSVGARLSPCSTKSAGPCAALLRLSWSAE